MKRGRVGVAISTTGQEHRLEFLETCVLRWDQMLGSDASLFVTVDGDAAAVKRVAALVYDITGSVYQVGQPTSRSVQVGEPTVGWGTRRQGVAVNKNTGLELLMDNAECEHLFLSDDDTWPLYPQSLTKHLNLKYPHSMVNWGAHRLEENRGILSMWKWPRGVVLYMHRDVVYRVGGMDERFGPGGHEHVEYSQRIHHAGFTPSPFISPASYATRNAMGASALWHAEDMPRPGEPRHNFASRKAATTSITRTEADWAHIDKIMAERQGSSDYVGFRAHENGRASATLSAYLTSQGAEGAK